MEAKHKFKFTQNWVNTVEPQAREVVYTDTECDGLQLVVSPKGRCSWRLYFSLNNEPQKRVFGQRRNPVTGIGMSLKEARIANDKLRSETIENGGLPPKGSESGPETLETLWTLFEKFHLPNMAEDTQRHYEMSYRLYVRKQFGSKPADEITKRMVVEWCDEVQRTCGLSCANKVLMIINLIYNKCRESDFYPGNSPAAGIKRIRDKENNGERDRYLNEEERELFIAEVQHKRQADPEFASWLLLLLFTGQRSNNVVRMKWSQLDFNSKTWTIPANETKARKHPFVVRLTDSAIDIIKCFPNDRQFVLHSNPEWKKQLNNWQKQWIRWRKRIGFGPLEGNEDNAVNPHDLRRTFGAILAQKQYSLHAIADALGQTSISATSIYARLNAAAKVDAFEMVEKVLLGKNGE